MKNGVGKGNPGPEPASGPEQIHDHDVTSDDADGVVLGSRVGGGGPGCYSEVFSSSVTEHAKVPVITTERFHPGAPPVRSRDHDRVAVCESDQLLAGGAGAETPHGRPGREEGPARLRGSWTVPSSWSTGSPPTGRSTPVSIASTG